MTQKKYFISMTVHQVAGNVFINQGEVYANNATITKIGY